MILMIGDEDWSDFPEVVCVNPAIEESCGCFRVCSNGILAYFNDEGIWQNVSDILWRTQLECNQQREYILMSMIEASDTYCLNSISAIRQYSDRISSYHVLRKSGIPIVPSFSYFGKRGYTYGHLPNFPCVAKVGNWHMGYGKMIIRNEEAWNDANDMFSISDDIVAIEDFVDNTKQMRVTLIGQDAIGIEVIGSQWKSNVNPKSVSIVEVPEILLEYTRKASITLGASIVGIDWLQDIGGQWFAIEANLAPGLCFPEADYRNYAITLLNKHR